ncbi:C40 family peptidase [Yersinia kristensenii]|uniref:C40 family peptidase n=1 Tax=Yersinia kristensenii TaxID=28152 RepID=UPI0011A54983|nr:C40 family peptidase [Yersinia kristensenii]MBW5811894.1 C40 family peptidase [Yersinia kristensenii]MBW5829434.1 C40 family peptidase [Yersinia kristensenii]MDA5489325.1 NlpC/P60 family protein [Yersinia kristensenii]
MRLIVTLFVLLFTQLFLNLAHASPQAHVSAEQKKGQISQASPDDRKKRKADRTTKKAKVTSDKTVSKNVTNKTIANNDKKKTAATASKVIKKKVQEVSNPTKKTNSNKTIPSKTIATKTPQIKTAAHKKVAVGKIEKVAYGRHRNKTQGKAETTLAANNKLKLSPAHKKRYQHAKQTAMSKLMKQVGKPYRWGGTSPNTGFDCSGLIYYAYKDVIRIKMPRTANEMYHLRDAAPVKRAELESGDLVFFNIANRGVADHVGVYLGNGKFIQSPRTGEEIRISMLDNDYWQDHYVGARRVVTPKTIR